MIRADQFFKACADESRLRILHLLSAGELCVCDLMDILKVPQPKVSRHLAYLRRHHLVQARKEGTWSYYSLQKPENDFHATLLACVNRSLNSLPVFQRDSDALRQLNQKKCG